MAFENSTQTCGQTNAEARARSRKPHAAQTRREGKEEEEEEEGLSLFVSRTCKTFCVEAQKKTKLPDCLLSSRSLPCPHFHHGTAIMRRLGEAASLFSRPDNSESLCKKREKTDRRTASPAFLKQARKGKKKHPCRQMKASL